MKQKRITYLVLLVLALSSSACASLLNKPKVRVNVHSNKTVSLHVFQDSFVCEEQQKVQFSLARAKQTINLLAKTDRLQDSIPIESKNSAAYQLNLLFTSWIGMLLERKNPKTYTYPKNIYLQVSDTSIQFSNIQLRHQPGELYVHFSLPHINTFLFKPVAEVDTKNSFGFLGISGGLDYYHRPRQYLSLKASSVIDFFIPVPVAVDYSGEYTVFNSSYISLSNNHRWKRWSLGYGLAATRNSWNFRYSDRFDAPPPTRIPASKSHWAMGIVLPIYYQKSPNFHFGLIYRPSFYRWDIQPQFEYEHLISIDFAWKIRIK